MYIFDFSCFVILCATLAVPSVSQTKIYRNDYKYNRKTDAFYKFHIEERRPWQAKDICKTEGASLMVPSSQADISQGHALFKEYPDIGPYAWIGSDGKSHDSVEEEALIEILSTDDNMHIDSDEEVLSRSGQVESYSRFHSLPFICKVEAKNAPYDSHCKVFGSDYVYYQSVGSCYKIPRIVFSWNQAYEECRAEGAHLVVLNSEAERDAVKNLTNTVPKVFGAKTSWFFFAGFRADKPVGNATRVFKTIFNQTLEEAGFAQWSPNEPNNYLSSEDCGTLFKNDGNLNDVDCSHEYAFVCEKEVQ
ncbi:hypothetical protein K1T71_004127 [Dendrolimus kikuchii]|uniref:Uncharacterized protein n=1 Tax=Dendrolimus kikuchii TaxID=765133 RepID=A0ACC1D9X6_9NEOP|nr:hypothetical protein K1T71_004127 [Dendrolimus kikuchii]